MAETAVHDALEAIDALASGVPGVKDAVDELAARRLERQKSRARRARVGSLVLSAAEMHLKLVCAPLCALRLSFEVEPTSTAASACSTERLCYCSV